MKKDFIKERIAAIRTSKNISARNLSLELGKSSEYINQIENGRLNPPIDFIIDFCDYFQLSLGEFFNEDSSYPLQYKELISELNKLTHSELDKIVDLVKLINTNKK